MLQTSSLLVSAFSTFSVVAALGAGPWGDVFSGKYGDRPEPEKALAAYNAGPGRVRQAGGIPAILGDCGGNLSCATCHVVVDPAWADRTGPATAFEHDMLDVTDAPRQPTSRLSCQLTMTAALDGLILHIPT